MDRQFVIENAQETERLRALVSRITDKELSFAIEGEWTIAVALAHLAFWDQRALVLVRKWGKSGVVASPADVDTINDALLPLCLAIPPRSAANLAVSSAEAIDRELEEVSNELISQIERLGSGVQLDRSKHRKTHLDEIESRLKNRPGIR